MTELFKVRNPDPFPKSLNLVSGSILEVSYIQNDDRQVTGVTLNGELTFPYLDFLEHYFPHLIRGYGEALTQDKPFTKHDSSKPELSYPLGMPNALSAIAKTMQYGAEKYARDNWKKATGTDINRYLDATIRHLSAHCANELVDEESGNPHIDHALTSLAMYVELYKKG